MIFQRTCRTITKDISCSPVALLLLLASSNATPVSSTRTEHMRPLAAAGSSFGGEIQQDPRLAWAQSSLSSLPSLAGVAEPYITQEAEHRNAIFKAQVK